MNIIPFRNQFSMKEENDTDINQVSKSSVTKIWIGNISMNFSILYLALATEQV